MDPKLKRTTNFLYEVFAAGGYSNMDYKVTLK